MVLILNNWYSMKKKQSKEIPPLRVTSGLGGVRENSSSVIIAKSDPDKEIGVNDKINSNTIYKPRVRKRKKQVFTPVYDGKVKPKLKRIKSKMGLSDSSIYIVALNYYYDSLQL